MLKVYLGVAVASLALSACGSPAAEDSPVQPETVCESPGPDDICLLPEEVVTDSNEVDKPVDNR